MVNIRERVFLISGTDFLQRQHAVKNIKERILKGKHTSLDTIIFYGKEAKLEDLAEKLLTASFEKIKIAVFKNSQDLSPAIRTFLFKNLNKISSANYLIFETDKDYYQFQSDKKFSADKLFSFILKKAAVFRISSTREKNTIEDFMASVRRNDLATSVYILEKLFKESSKSKLLGPQIIGILVQKLSYLRSPSEKERCFQCLWEADRAIKEKGLDPRLIIETLLAKVLKPH
ncbi:MAG: hypothetical protein ABIE75_01525 [Candidatus Omnitrophota bacterium]